VPCPDTLITGNYTMKPKLILTIAGVLYFLGGLAGFFMVGG
jgi:hypothetical protein